MQVRSRVPEPTANFIWSTPRIVGHKPKTLRNAEAAALPLTAITAWEMLFDRLDIRRSVPGAANAILIIGGAGGVGSIAIQLVRALSDVTVIATASRPETQKWVRDLGAHHVVDHTKTLAEQIDALGIGRARFCLPTTATLQHLSDIVKLIAPQGRFGLIDDPKVLDIVPFKRKSVSIHWELMFTRPLFSTADMQEQGALLNEVARLVDSGRLRTTLTEVLKPINASNLMRAHALIESGRAKGNRSGGLLALRGVFVSLARFKSRRCPLVRRHRRNGVRLWERGRKTPIAGQSAGRYPYS